ncbi:MAG: TRAP transporter fused permease subunit [Thiohalomonadales bacterium]|nr:TRAP transporter fused permease subunit [Thiohalomonadales bacterium]
MPETKPSPTTSTPDAQALEVGLRKQPIVQHIIYLFGAITAALHLVMNFTTLFSTQWQATLHFVTLGLLCVLLYPPHRSERMAVSRLWLAMDIVFGLIVISATVWLIASEDAIYARGVSLTVWEQTMALLTIIGAIEFTRRTTGWIIPALIIISLTYVVWWGDWLNNVFRFGGLSLETLLFRSVFGDDALFGNIAQISVSFVFMFILFGAFLLRSGAGDFVIAMARALAGRIVGGPGLVAVIASGLTGTISGSAIANTVSTGVVTIPLMKRAGFPARFAAGVESAASTGGQLMPPIMGAGAFVMASYTQISYTHIVLVAFLPALLYFLSVAFFVRLEAKRLDFKIEDAEEVPRLTTIMKQGGVVFIIPISVLITLLVLGFTPTYAAGIAILSVVGASWLTPRKMGPRAILDALALGSRNMITTGLLLVAVGLVVNVIAMTGIGNTLSLMIQQWAGGNLLLALILVTLASLVLGMGLPVTAAYIVLATLSAPALYNLMADIKVIELLASGSQLPEAMQAMVMLAAPELTSRLGQVMSMEEARGVLESLRAVDPSLVISLYNQMLDPLLTTSLLLSAHMIIFWLSQDSNVTPPVCLTAFAAAAIAGTPQLRTGFTAWKLAKGLYILPLLFAYTPFLYGDWIIAIEIFFFSLVGLYAFAAAFQGHLETDHSIPLRLIIGLIAVLLLWPNNHLLHWLGLLAFVVIFFWDWQRSRKMRQHPA